MERISGKKSELINLLKKTAPGTPLREGLDGTCCGQKPAD